MRYIQIIAKLGYSALKFGAVASDTYASDVEFARKLACTFAT